MKTRYRYYCLDKPPMPGTVPRGMIHIEDFKEVRYIDAIGCEACGYAEYDRILTESEIQRHKMMAEPADGGCGDDYCDF